MGTLVKPRWTCPSCGSGLNARAKDCCDTCILTIFTGEYSPELGVALAKYNSCADWNNDPTNYSDEDDNGLVIPATATCSHTLQVEYAHQNDNCDFQRCWVAECSDCHAFVTECGMEG